MRALHKDLRLSITLIAVSCLSLACAFAQSQASLKVTVLTKRGHPVRGAALTLAAEDRIRLGVTNGKGEFEFDDLPDLRFVLESAYHDFPISTIPEIQLHDPSPRDLSITLDPPGGYLAKGYGASTPCMLINIEFAPNGHSKISYEERQGKMSLIGTIDILGRDMKIGIDHAAKIAVLKTGQLEMPIAEVQSNNLGEYHFDDLEPGRYRLKVSHKGSYTGTTMEFWIARQNTTQLGPIIMYPEGMTDACGTEREFMPFDDPVNPDPEPELIDPNRKP